MASDVDYDDDDAVHIDDDDGGTDSDADICDRCDCPRDMHDEDGKGACLVCGDRRCKKFKEV